jgi:hypothetical protein
MTWGFWRQVVQAGFEKKIRFPEKKFPPAALYEV